MACNGVAYGNGVYVAVGTSGYIQKSTDGVTWTIEKTSAFLNVTYNRVAYGNGLFVAITQDGKILTSPDGSAWTQQTSGTTNYLKDIVYANSAFFVVGGNATALTSTNGTTWTAVNTGAAATDALLSIVYGAGKFVIGVRDAANSGSVALCSTTGASGTWTSTTITNGLSSLNRISWLNNKFYLFTSSTAIYTSANGSSWSPVNDSRLTSPNQIFHGIYDGAKYYLFGNSQEYGSVFTSTDGNTYTLQAQSTTIVAQHSEYVNGRYFQVGNEGLVSSSNGTAWNFPGASYNGLATNGSRYVAVGQATSNQGSIYTSTNWTSWSSALSTIIKALNGVTYGGGKFVAVGNTDAGGFSTVASSVDGLTWTTGNSGIADNLRAVAYGNSRYVAVGLNGRIIYSSNGTAWTSAETVSGYHYYGVSYLNGHFVAVGGSTTLATGQTKVKYSADGIAWTDASPSIIGHFHSIAYGGGKYVLVGRDNTSGSTKFFSVTTTDITNAANFTAAVTATTPEGNVGTSGYGSVAYNNGTFAAVVNLNATPFSAYALTSATGTGWTATTANTTGRLRAIMPSGTGFRVVGTTDTRVTVNNGSILPVHLLAFSVRGGNDGAQLNWKTETEKAAAGFSVQRSGDGTNFHSIGYVPAANTGGVNQYDFTDALALAGKNFYRLKLGDKDGKFSYSAVVLYAKPSEQNALQVFPNPSNDFISVGLADAVSVKVYNGKGELVISEPAAANKKIDVRALGAGLYVVQATDGAKVYTGRFSKQ